MATEPGAITTSGTGPPDGGPPDRGIDSAGAVSALGAARPDVAALLAAVPPDPWSRVRLVAMCIVAVVFAWFTRTQGLIVDRISISIAIAVFVVAAFVGAPLRRWAQVGVDALAYAVLWLAYESTRGAADELGMPMQLQVMRDLDGLLFAGTQPTEWAQRAWYEPGVVQWHDAVLSLVYYSHFVVPAVAIAALWAASRTMWLRYMRRLATVVAVACLCFVVVPTVPPWIASDPRFGFGVGEPLARHVRSGIVELGFGGFARDWEVAAGWSNPFAAMPSLHAAFSLLVVVFVAPLVRRRWVRAMLYVYPALMGIALVYFAEHWVVDVLAGWLLVAASFALWSRVERRGRRVEVDRAIADLASTRAGIRADPSPDPRFQPPGRARRAMPVRDPDVVLLDRSFLRALTDPGSHDHHAVADAYTTLLDRFVADEVRLVARADHLGDLDPLRRAGLLSPVRPVHVAPQHRRQATRWAPRGASPGADRDERVPGDTGAPDALTLVVARRAGAVDVYAT